MGACTSSPPPSPVSDSSIQKEMPRDKMTTKGSKKKSKNKREKTERKPHRTGADEIDRLLASCSDISDAMSVVLRWVQAKNQQNMLTMYTVTDDDAIFHFPDTNVHLPMRPFWDSMMALFCAFPDLTFSYRSITETKPGVVVLKGYYAEGHHKGGPLHFPGKEPVPPTGAFVQDEPILLTVTVRDRKVFDMVADTNGGLAGPPGFYAKALHAYQMQQAAVLQGE